jgi:ABC-type sulfate/molybdate transport systems ATPase subunit
LAFDHQITDNLCYSISVPDTSEDSFQIPVIVITHDPEDAAILSQTVVIYEAGRVRQIMPVSKFGSQLKEAFPFPSSRFAPA